MWCAIIHTPSERDNAVGEWDARWPGIVGYSALLFPVRMLLVRGADAELDQKTGDRTKEEQPIEEIVLHCEVGESGRESG